MIREIVFVDSKKVGFIMADQVAQGMVLQPKFIHVGDLVALKEADYEVFYKVAAISNGEDAGDYGDLCVYKLNEAQQDIVSPFDVTKIYREVTP